MNPTDADPLYVEVAESRPGRGDGNWRGSHLVVSERPTDD